MKKIFLFILWAVLPAYLWAAGDFPSLENQIKKSLQEKRISSFLSLVIEVEEPTEYQREEMIKLENKLYRLASEQEFKDFAQLAKFLDDLMPEAEYDTIFIKDAFPMQEGAKPKGDLDCDGRTFYALGVLERLGNPFKVYAVSQIDHMLLTDGNLFYDLLYKEFGRKPMKNEWSFSFPFITKQELHGHLLANKAVYFWKGGGKMFYDDQLPFIEKGFPLAEKAYEKNPKNVSLLLNWYKMLNENKDDFSFPQILEALGLLLGRAETEGLTYKPVYVPQGFYMDGNDRGKIIKEKIKETLTLNKWIAYTLQRVGNLYGLDAEKFILELYMEATPDIYGQNQRTYACVLHALGHLHEEVLEHRHQADKKFYKYIKTLDQNETPEEELFSLNIIYKYQVNVTDYEFLRYCEKTFRPRKKVFN